MTQHVDTNAFIDSVVRDLSASEMSRLHWHVVDWDDDETYDDYEESAMRHFDDALDRAMFVHNGGECNVAILPCLGGKDVYGEECWFRYEEAK